MLARHWFDRFAYHPGKKKKVKVTLYLVVLFYHIFYHFFTIVHYIK